VSDYRRVSPPRLPASKSAPIPPVSRLGRTTPRWVSGLRS
jgi:hypothetical protein